MKFMYVAITLLLVACNNGDQSTETVKKEDTIKTTVPKPDTTPDEPPPPPPPADPKIYSNARFKEVTVEKTGDHKFLIKGKGQIFEANFSWVVEDGHNEIKKGHEMTDAGAPEWGKFSFTVDVEKQRPNSTLTLILFEASAMDGSRQHQLPIVLY